MLLNCVHYTDLYIAKAVKVLKIAVVVDS